MLRVRAGVKILEEKQIHPEESLTKIFKRTNLELG